jgi:betaine lipid synthase
MTGHFLRDNCPSYLKEENFNRLKDGLLNRLTISTCFFLDELRARKYSKVCALDCRLRSSDL